MLCLLIVVVVQLAVAFLGYNLIHVFERYAFPVLVIIFVIASAVTLGKAHPGAVHHTIPGAFLIELGATFGYAVGWNPYASDYTRYFKPETSKRAIAFWAGLGSVTQGALSARGPQYGVPQMVLSRLGFGYWGNTLPAGLNAITAGRVFPQ